MLFLFNLSFFALYSVLYPFAVCLSLQGRCVITVQLADEELAADGEGVDYFLLFAGSTQRHLTSTLRSSHDTLQAVCPGKLPHPQCLATSLSRLMDLWVGSSTYSNLIHAKSIFNSTLLFVCVKWQKGACLVTFCLPRLVWVNTIKVLLIQRHCELICCRSITYKTESKFSQYPPRNIIIFTKKWEQSKISCSGQFSIGIMCYSPKLTLQGAKACQNIPGCWKQ